MVRIHIPRMGISKKYYIARNQSFFCVLCGDKFTDAVMYKMEDFDSDHDYWLIAEKNNVGYVGWGSMGWCPRCVKSLQEYERRISIRDEVIDNVIWGLCYAHGEFEDNRMQTDKHPITLQEGDREC